MKRLYQQIVEDHFLTNKQMAFVCGPRQVGKTTIAQALRNKAQQFAYRNWDTPEDRIRITQSSYQSILENLTLSPATHPLIVLDEIHKFPDWKNYVKGFYDSYQGQMDILVTGSARLDIYRKGGDSLMGRYFLYRVHPITVGEVAERGFALFQSPTVIAQDKVEHLLHFGGFPEPWSKANDRFLNKWRHLRQQQLIYEDIRGLETIHNLSQLDLLSTLLRHQVGQLVNYSNLATKVRVTVPTIQRWISVLEQSYYCYMLTPWSQNIARSLLKEPKVYLWDWSLVSDVGMRHENFVASHLLKAVHFWTDIGLGVFGLHFIRTKDQHEVDFLITKDAKPWILIEVKSSSKAPLSKSLQKYQKELDCAFAFQVVFDLLTTDSAINWLVSHVLHGEGAPAVILPAASVLSLLA